VQSPWDKAALSVHFHGGACKASFQIPFWDKILTTMPLRSRFHPSLYLRTLSPPCQNRSILRDGNVDYDLESMFSPEPDSFRKSRWKILSHQLAMEMLNAWSVGP
jgi:hypothetical protein